MSQRYLVPALALLMIVSGCGRSDLPELADVSGRVTYNGDPVSGLTVIYQAAEGRPSYGRTNENGIYEMNYNVDASGVKAGPATVMFDPFSSESGSDPNAPSEQVEPSPLIKKIPRKYFTGFQTVTIEPGENTFDFEVAK